VAGARLHEGRLLVTFAAAERPSGQARM
jgi:hypothetical protein